MLSLPRNRSSSCQRRVRYDRSADGIWGLWPLGGAWLCFNMWEHYLFTLDEDYLRNIAYPYIKESARFFLDYMIEDENGVLLSGPSTSPGKQL